MDFSSQTDELVELGNHIDSKITPELFAFGPATPESEYPTSKIYELAGRILYIRGKISGILCEMEEVMEEDLGEDDAQEALEKIYEEYHLDSGADAELTTDMVDLKNTSFAIAYVTRYKDMIKILLDYCQTLNVRDLQKAIKKIPESDRKGINL